MFNLKNSVEFFPSRSLGGLRIAFGFRPAAAGNPALFCSPDLPMETLNCRIRVNKLSFKIILSACLCGMIVNSYCETPAISCGELNRNMSGQGPKMVVVDVRGAGDFERGHIPSAINAPYDSIDKANLPQEGMLVLYCGNNQCPWSKLGAKTLEQSGYKNVMVLDGGIITWTAEGFALEASNVVDKKNTPIPVAAIAPGKMLKLLGDKTIGIIDTRPETEFKIAHLPGARNIAFEGLNSGIAGLSEESEWVVYDKQPEIAKAAARQMTEKGFRVKELSGGIQVWSAKKYPLETGLVK